MCMRVCPAGSASVACAALGALPPRGDDAAAAHLDAFSNVLCALTRKAVSVNIGGRVGNMMDVVSPKKRSLMMAGIKGKDTKPEMAVRKTVHAMGFRFRLHRKDLPGSPDLVFPRLRKVIFVHGCFWHQHHGCRFAYLPKSNVQFWHDKLESNRRRDAQVLERLSDVGWEHLIVWECEISDKTTLALKLNSFLAKGLDRGTVTGKHE